MANSVSELLKFCQLQGASPPRPQYRLTLRAHHECCPPTFETVDMPLIFRRPGRADCVQLCDWLLRQREGEKGHSPITSGWRNCGARNFWLPRHSWGKPGQRRFQPRHVPLRLHAPGLAQLLGWWYKTNWREELKAVLHMP
jgi:hypothetical protein